MQKNLTLVLLLGCVVHFAFAQTKHFTLGISAAPTFAHYILTDDGSLPKPVANLFRSTDKPRLGVTAYAVATYAFNTRSSAQLGLGYAQSGNKTQKGELFFSVPDPVAPKYGQFVYTYLDAYIPLLYRYNLTQQRHRLFVTGGLAGTLAISRKIVTRLWYADGRYERKSENETGNFRTFNALGVLGAGIDFSLSSRFSLTFQPTFNYSLLGLVKGVAINRHPYSIGAGIALIKRS